MPQLFTPEEMDQLFERDAAEKAAQQSRTPKQKQAEEQEQDNYFFARRAGEMALGAAQGAALARAGGPRAMAVAGTVGAVAPGAIRAAESFFGVEPNPSAERAGLAAQTGELLGTLGGPIGRATGAGLGATLEQLYEGKSPQEALREGLVQGPGAVLGGEGAARAGEKFFRGVGQAGQAALEKIKNRFSTNVTDLANQARNVLKNVIEGVPFKADPRFGAVPKELLGIDPNKSLIEVQVKREFAEDLLPGTSPLPFRDPRTGRMRSSLTIPLGTKDEIATYTRFANLGGERGRQAVLKKFEDPLKFAAFKATLTPEVKSQLEVDWVQKEVFDKAKNIKPGDLLKLPNAEVKRITTVLGPNAPQALQELDKFIEAAPLEPKFGKFLSHFFNRVEGSVQFNISRILLGGTASGFATGLMNPMVGVTLGGATLLAAAAASPTFMKMLSNATRQNSPGAVANALRIIDQEYGWRLEPKLDERGEIVPDQLELRPPGSNSPGRSAASDAARTAAGAF